MNWTDKIQVFSEDCMKTMSRYEDNYFDLAIVDPPYGIGEDGKKNHSRDNAVKSTKYSSKNWDSIPPSELYFETIKSKCKNYIIWGANYFKSLVGETFKPPKRTNDYIEFIKAYPRNFIIWDKVNGKSDFSDCELAFTNLDINTTIVYYMWAGMMQGKTISKDYNRAKVQIGNKKLNEKRIHPTQKPVKLYDWLLSNYAKPNFEILDTHLGSGSIAIACHNYGCELVAAELDKDYYNESLKRFKDITAQTKLF